MDENQPRSQGLLRFESGDPGNEVAFCDRCKASQRHFKGTCVVAMTAFNHLLTQGLKVLK